MKNNNNTLELTKPVDMVKIASTRVVPGDVDPEELERLIKQRDSMARTYGRLLPMEEASSNGVIRAVAGLRLEVARLERRKRIVEFSKGKYQLQMTEPLKWRRANSGFPVFGVFRANIPNFGFIADAGRVVERSKVLMGTGFEQVTGSIRMVPALPKIVFDCYGDIVKMIDQRAQSRLATIASNSRAQGIEMTLLAKFSGLVPDEVKEEWARAARSGLFQSFFIIAEVEQWEWNVTVTSRQGDPILIGFDGHELWRIAVFDTTSVEQLMADEYSIKAD